MKFLKEHTLFVFILLVCAILRFIPFFDYQYTLDELSGLGRTTFDNFGDLIEKGVKTTDTHPALIQVLIYYLSKAFGYANWVIKLPFLLMSFGAIIYAYAFCLRHFSKQAGIFATVILSFSLIFVFYAPIARMYIPGVFFSMALLYYFFEIFFLKQLKISNYFFLGLFALLSALNQHLNALFALTVCASGFLFLSKENFKYYLVTCLATVLCYLPHLPVTLYQLKLGGIGFEQDGWLPPPEKDALLKFLKVLLGTGKSYIILLLIILAPVNLKRKVKPVKQQWFLLVIFLVNYFVIYFYSVYRAPVFQYSVMLFSAVALVVFIASLMEYSNKHVFHTAVILLSGILIYKTYFKKDYMQQSVKTIFEYQFERTAHYKRLYGDQAVYPVFFDADEFMKSIYFQKYGRFDCKITSDSLTRLMHLYSHFVSGLKADYLVLASSMPAYQAVAAEHFPYLVENVQTQAINYKVYSKRKEDAGKVVKDDVITEYSSPANPGKFKYNKMQKVIARNNLFLLPVDSVTEFPFDAAAHYKDVVQSEGQMIQLKTKIKLNHPGNSHITGCIGVNDAGDNASYMYASKETGDFVIRPDSTVTSYSDNFFGTAHKKAKRNSNINCYLWNRNKENFELLDFEVRVIDYWHMKWHFWE